MRLQFAPCLCRDLHIDWRSSKIRCKPRQVSCNINVGQQKCRTSCGLWRRGWLQLTSVNEISRKFSQNAENAALNKHPIKVSPSEIVWKVHYWQADLKIFATRTARRWRFLQRWLELGKLGHSLTLVLWPTHWPASSPSSLPSPHLFFQNINL